MIKIKIHEASCKRCGRCARVCPMGVFASKKGEAAQVEKAKACVGCGHCLDVCLGDCITHSDFPEGMLRTINESLLPHPEQLMELIRSRRSNRALSDAPIPAEALSDILEAARYAPTAENKRQIALTVINEPEGLQAIEDAVMRFFLLLVRLLMNPLMRPLSKMVLPDLYNEAPEIARFEQLWRAGKRPCSCNAKMMIAFSAPAKSDFGSDDSNLAYQNASLMAQAHGISQIYMGLIQTALKLMGRRKQRRLLGIPQGHKLCALMGLGMPAFPFRRYTVR